MQANANGASGAQGAVDRNVGTHPKHKLHRKA